jgi:hypothetical protein
MYSEILCVKICFAFAKGAALKDPARLSNSGLEGNVRRAIDIREGEKINESALKELIREAVELNRRRLRREDLVLTRKGNRPVRDFRVAWKNALAKIEA